MLQIYLFSALLLMTLSSIAQSGSVNTPLLISATTVPHEIRAQAFDAHDGKAEENQKDYRHRLFPTAAGGEEAHEIRIQLTPGLPSHVSLQGKHAAYWRYTVDQDSILIIRTTSGSSPEFNSARSLLNVVVHY